MDAWPAPLIRTRKTGGGGGGGMQQVTNGSDGAAEYAIVP